MESYLYQYGVGVAVFALGLAVVWRTGQVGMGAGPPRRHLLVLVLGLIFFALLQGVLVVVGG